MNGEDDNGGMDKWLDDLSRETGRAQEGEMGGGQQSREYEAYREAEREAMEKNWYEKLAAFSGGMFKAEPFEDVEDDVRDALNFLQWDVQLNHVTPAALTAALAVFVAVIPLLIVPIPVIFKLFLLAVPAVVFFYLAFYPVIAAKRKLISSSGDSILAVLYMVIYMRSSPNLEGAVRFVAENLQGAIAKDFRRMLWAVQAGAFTSMREALDEYKEIWRPYNKDFVETLNVIGTALQETSAEQQRRLFEEAIGTLLESAQYKMKDYSRNLKTPVMFVQGMGVLLPVLLMILFPLISAFVGGEGLGYYLSAGYNIILPVLVFFVMQQVLLSRPPTTSTTLLASGDMPEEGRYPVEVNGRTYNVPMLPVSILVFLVLGFWPLQHYIGIMFGSGSLPLNPSTLDIFRSLMLPLATAVSMGLYLMLGYKRRVAKEKQIEEIESEFPQALFVLGDALGRGSPVEVAIDDAIRNMSGLKIVELFERISNNIKTMGMTFQQAIFDRDYGALKEYPSNLIESVMKAIQESSGKGTGIVSAAMKTISNYLKKVQQTQRKIEDMMGETLSTMAFISYFLAPIIAGIAVGMGMVITDAFSKIGESFEGIGNATQTAPSGGGPVSGVQGAQNLDIGSIFNFSGAVPPEVIQLVVGFYFVELAILLGVFYVRLSEGRKPAKRNVTIGRILLVGSVLYAATVLIITTLFGGIIGSIGGGV